MSKSLENKSVVDTYTRNALILIVLSAVAVGSFISFFSFYEFVQASKRLEEKNLVLHKLTLRREVTRVEELIKFERSKLDSLTRKNIKNRVYEAHAIATGLYEKYKNISSLKLTSIFYTHIFMGQNPTLSFWIKTIISLLQVLNQ